MTHPSHKVPASIVHLSMTDFFDGLRLDILKPQVLGPRRSMQPDGRSVLAVPMDQYRAASTLRDIFTMSVGGDLPLGVTQFHNIRDDNKPSWRVTVRGNPERPSLVAEHANGQLARSFLLQENGDYLLRLEERSSRASIESSVSIPQYLTEGKPRREWRDQALTSEHIVRFTSRNELAVLMDIAADASAEVFMSGLHAYLVGNSAVVLNPEAIKFTSNQREDFTQNLQSLWLCARIGELCGNLS